MSKIGVGIIGCGNISAAYLKLAPIFKSLEVRAVSAMAAATFAARCIGAGARRGDGTKQVTAEHLNPA